MNEVFFVFEIIYRLNKLLHICIRHWRLTNIFELILIKLYMFGMFKRKNIYILNQDDLNTNNKNLIILNLNIYL